MFRIPNLQGREAEDAIKYPDECREAVLVLSHKFGRAERRLLAGLSSSLCSKSRDFFLLCHAEDNEAKRDIQGHLRRSQSVAEPWFFSLREIQDAGFPMLRDTIVPGSTHLPLLLFSMRNPQYDYIWLIEYDVRFSGKWPWFFDYWRGSTAHFLTCRLQPHHENPTWYWWKSLSLKDPLPLPALIRSFNPIYRISRDACRFLVESARAGNVGHYEVLVPTLLLREGFVLEDLGGVGPFVAPKNTACFYTSMHPNHKPKYARATFRWRPEWHSVGLRRDSLYHPVKRDLPRFIGLPLTNLASVYYAVKGEIPGLRRFIRAIARA